MSLQSATAYVITKCDNFHYKVRELFYYKVRQVLLQSATGIIKCDNFITKWDRYYKVRRLLQSATEHVRFEKAVSDWITSQEKKSSCKLGVLQEIKVVRAGAYSQTGTGNKRTTLIKSIKDNFN